VVARSPFIRRGGEQTVVACSLGDGNDFTVTTAATSAVPGGNKRRKKKGIDAFVATLHA
jgi:hypothetical protein